MAFLLLGGVVGLAVSLLVMVASLSAMVSRRVERWRTRKVERYLDEVDATQDVLREQLTTARREIAARDQQIARLQRRDGDPSHCRTAMGDRLRRAPRSIRRTGRDPRVRGRELREEAAALLDAATATRETWAVRPPLLVTAAGSLDAAVSAAGPRIDVLSDAELLEAADRAHLDLAAATEADGLALQGFVSGLRGAAGELRALDALTEGALPAPDGSSRVELIAHEYPGVDLTFHDANGALVDTANVKVAGNPDVVLRHFGRHPDVRLVYAPTDTAESLGRMGFEVVGEEGNIPPEGPVVIDLGAPTDAFDQEVRATLADTVVDATTPLWTLVPWFGFSAVGVRAVRRFAAGADPATMRALGAGDLFVATTASSVGKVAAWSSGSALGAIPFAIVAAWAAQAATATRRTWREAADRERGLRAQLLDAEA